MDDNNDDVGNVLVLMIAHWIVISKQKVMLCRSHRQTLTKNVYQKTTKQPNYVVKEGSLSKELRLEQDCRGTVAWGWQPPCWKHTVKGWLTCCHMPVGVAVWRIKDDASVQRLMGVCWLDLDRLGEGESKIVFAIWTVAGGCWKSRR